MFSDSHCHLFHILQKTAHFPLILKMMEEEAFPFVMDIGTEAGDLSPRYHAVSEAWGDCGKVPDFIHFSAGLWPGKAAIAHQDSALAALAADLQTILQWGQGYAAVGECGIDRYWNRADSTPAHSPHSTDDLAGEELLFKKQLDLARRYGLAVIVHSRDGFEPTLRCIDEVGWHRGVIHCFSYGKVEAEAFLKRGWYLSFTGGITYADNPAAAAEIKDLLCSVPEERLLLETDAPYLAPLPVKRDLNTPLYIPYTYRQASSYLQCSVEDLCRTVYRNCRILFAVPNHEGTLERHNCGQYYGSRAVESQGI